MLLAIVTVFLSLSPAPSVEAVRKAAHEVSGDSSIQHRLPGDGGDHDLKPRRRDATRARIPSSGNPVAQLALYVVMAVVLALVLLFLLRGTMGYDSGGTIADEAIAGSELDENVVRRPLGDAEALADEGRYAEAVHTLLLKTLVELVQRHGHSLPPSLTSREILARIGLPGAARDALGEIVDVVEISHFGDVPIGQAEYERCLDSYGRFSDALLAPSGGLLA